MKIILVSSVASLIAMPLFAQLSPVQISVEPCNTRKGTPSADQRPPDAKTGQGRSLKITVTNVSGQPLANVSVRWAIMKSWRKFYPNIFGGGIIGREDPPIPHGAVETFDLGPREARVIETAFIEAERAGGVRDSTGTEHRNQEKIEGYGVQVMLNGKVVAEDVVGSREVKEAFRSSVLRVAKSSSPVRPATSGQPRRTQPVPPSATPRVAPVLPPTAGGVRSGQSFVNSIGIELVWIPPGEFMMGTTLEEQEWATQNGCSAEWVKREGEQPRKAKIKDAFWLGRTEVTVGQWKEFVRATAYVTDAENKGESWSPRGPGKPWGMTKGVNWKDPNFGFELKDNHPVSCISWNDAMAFCEWLNERESKAGRLPTGYLMRLPTEAEWEYACRAGAQTKFWWGDSVKDGDNRLNWPGTEDGFLFVSPVAHYSMRGLNKFGLADMLGNVWEWCLDDFDPTQAHEECWKGNTQRRAIKGGAFNSPLGRLRCGARNTDPRTASFACHGFRLACALPR